MFWNSIGGVVIVLLVVSGLFGGIPWNVNIPLIGVVLIIWLVSVYNGFVALRMRVHEALSDIDVQLKRRYDLIPNLIEAVKGYMGHEKGVLEQVTEARAKITQGGSPIDRAGAEAVLSGSLGRLLAVAESYPDLKANTNFLDLQNELTDTEDKIQAARRFHNSTVMALNAGIMSFPGNIIAGIFGFKQEKFFEIGNTVERENVKVKF